MFFFFNDTATTEIYTLSLHDALPICARHDLRLARRQQVDELVVLEAAGEHQLLRQARPRAQRSEEHTSELQSRQYLVCRLLLEKKKTSLTTLLSHYYLSTSALVVFQP